jgi:hypothetical protein
MNITNLTRTAVASLIVACATTAQTNAMMVRYLASLAGDTCVAAAMLAMDVKQKMTSNDEKEFLKRGATHGQVNQLKRDAEKISPYVPALIPLGAVLSLGSRISMISKAGGKGIALALLSMPINGALIKAGYEARLEQAPDATMMDKAKDQGSSLYNKIFNRKNS